MTYVEKLQNWYDTERAAGRVLDIKFFPRYICFPGMEEPIKIDDGPDPTIEEMAEWVYKIVTGETPTVDVSDENL